MTRSDLIKRPQPGGGVLVGLQMCLLTSRRQNKNRHGLGGGRFQLNKRADAEDLLGDRIFLALTLGLGEFRAELRQLFAAFASPSQFTLPFTSSHDSL